MPRSSAKSSDAAKSASQNPQNSGSSGSRHSALYNSLHSQHESPPPSVSPVSRSRPMFASVSAPSPTTTPPSASRGPNSNPVSHSILVSPPHPNGVLRTSPEAISESPGRGGFPFYGSVPITTSASGLINEIHNNQAPLRTPRPSFSTKRSGRPLPILFKDENVREQFMRERMMTMLEASGLEPRSVGETNGHSHGHGVSGDDNRDGDGKKSADSVTWEDDANKFGDAKKNSKSHGMSRQGTKISMYREFASPFLNL